MLTVQSVNDSNTHFPLWWFWFKCQFSVFQQWSFDGNILYVFESNKYSFDDKLQIDDLILKQYFFCFCFWFDGLNLCAAVPELSVSWHLPQIVVSPPMMSAGVNVTSLPILVTSVTLDGRAQLSNQRLFFFFFFFLCVYLFMLCSDSLVVYVICSQRSLHRPMFVFVAAVLMNSVAGSTVFYPKLLVDLLRGVRSVQVTLRGCMCEAWLLRSVDTSSFLLLAAMSFVYVSICRPLLYTVVMSPATVLALLLLCWLLPVGLVGTAVLLASRLPLAAQQDLLRHLQPGQSELWWSWDTAERSLQPLGHCSYCPAARHLCALLLQRRPVRLPAALAQLQQQSTEHVPAAPARLL